MRNAIALLVTLFLMMLIVVAVGLGLQRVNAVKETVEKERFMLQSGIVIEDVLGLLNDSPQIKAIVDDNTSASLHMLLDSASMIPFESGEYRILVTLSSARSRLNINTLQSGTPQQQTRKASRLRAFFLDHGIGGELADYLEDAMGGIRADGGYRTDLFIEEPTLFRDFIASPHHLQKILDVYAKNYHLDPYSKLDFGTLFTFDRDPGTKVDLNFATPEVWELLTGVSEERARQLTLKEGSYTRLEDVGLSEDERARLSLFGYSFFEPVILVHIDMQKGDIEGSVEFEYDLKNKKAKNFVYGI